VSRHPEKLLERPWPDDAKIPWNEPAFSRRMLKEHLSQDHDAASRRLETVEAHVNWIHDELLARRPSRILDLGCGPGLYAVRLARLQHRVTGIDFSPASIEHARESARREGLNCNFIEGDVTAVDLGGGFDLAMFIFGEITVFDRTATRRLLERICGSLSPGGTLLLEPPTDAAIRESASLPLFSEEREHGLFSDRPHLYVQEQRWLEEERVAQTRFIIRDAESGEVQDYGQRMYAWTVDEYQEILTEAGFLKIETYPSLRGVSDPTQPGLIALTATC